ncbi:helix-turn-helix domain-containing protein [Nocardia jinanensis]|uniref:Transcriptional regulator n=1 Tax=Nocardia jinanensis TaxID=382504 RepID=A0A917RVC3_9NOCA|nr:helix-turn-helix transcriptional regulator [Nocardia jinanensis]GGL35257.1 transcriptional regulator [Nocardia jinanensis]
MPSKANLSGTTLPRRQLGRALRDARHAQGATLEQVARDTEFSRATLSRIELGQYERIKVREVEYLCRHYGLSADRTTYLAGLASQANTKVWWQGYQHLLVPGYSTYLALESSATEFHFFQPLVVPGLLQTADYVRTLQRLFAPDAPSEEIEKHVELREQRRRRVTQRHSRARVEFLIHESALHSVVGSNRIMAAQCHHIVDMSTRDNVVVRVLPFAVGVPAGSVVTPFIIIDFPDNEPSVVYAEAAIGSMTFDDTEDVNNFRVLFDKLRNAALEEQHSRDRIRKIAGRFQQ